MTLYPKFPSVQCIVLDNTIVIEFVFIGDDPIGTSVYGLLETLSQIVALHSCMPFRLFSGKRLISSPSKSTPYVAHNDSESFTKQLEFHAASTVYPLGTTIILHVQILTIPKHKLRHHYIVITVPYRGSHNSASSHLGYSCGISNMLWYGNNRINIVILVRDRHLQ